MDGPWGEALRSFKSVFDVAKALLPVLYNGGLLYYFADVGGSWQNIQDLGLGPTILGLGAVGLLFCIPLALKIFRLRRGRPGSGGGTPGDQDDDDGGAAADAAIARYMARKATEEATAKPAANSPSVRPARPAPQIGGSAGRPGFGRRGG